MERREGDNDTEGIQDVEKGSKGEDMKEIINRRISTGIIH
jgi:hypothetical protein